MAPSLQQQGGEILWQKTFSPNNINNWNQTSSFTAIRTHSCWLFIAALLLDLEGVQHRLCKHRKWWGGGEDDDMWQRSWTAFRATQARARGVPPTVFRHLNRMKAGWPLMFSNHKSNVPSLLYFKSCHFSERVILPFYNLHYILHAVLLNCAIPKNICLGKAHLGKHQIGLYTRCTIVLWFRIMHLLLKSPAFFFFFTQSFSLPVCIYTQLHLIMSNNQTLTLSPVVCPLSHLSLFSSLSPHPKLVVADSCYSLSIILLEVSSF